MASRVPRNSRLRDLEEGIPKLKNMCQFASLPASESGEANETRVWSVLQDLSPRVSESSNSTVIRIDWHEKIMAQTAPQMLKTCVDYMQLIPDIGFFCVPCIGRWGNFIMEKPSHPADDVARFGVPTANCAGCCDTTPIHRSPSDRRAIGLALGIFWAETLDMKLWKTWRKHLWTEYSVMLLYKLAAFGVGILDKNHILKSWPRRPEGSALPLAIDCNEQNHVDAYIPRLYPRCCLRQMIIYSNLYTQIFES